MNRVRAVGTGVAGAPFYMNLYFSAAVGTPQQASDAVRTLLVAAAGMECTPLRWTMDSQVPQVESTTGDIVNSIGVTPGADVLATSSGDVLPLQAQVGVRLTTGTYVAGRAIRGHFSVPYIAEALNSTGGGPSTGGTAAIAFQNALTALAASSTVAWVVYSRKNGVFSVVQSAQISTRYFTLRSRQT